ncbi:Csu type fimbrial protein [Thalassospira marina]|uniref:Spore coat protein U n=1 Tax=Thalassospira marina TaxID=2048283 RepID=A0ABN5FQC4_9PROT|nr:spore coat U domain-containing protein [Thalassospira marina]AUG53830.1 spore coat protein U [Thalassospira marina]
MGKFRILHCIIVVLVFGFVSLARAQTSTAQFNVQITITAECQVDSAEDMDFASFGVLDSNVQSSSSVSVQCTNDTAYNVGLSPGLGVGATVAGRLMTGPGGQTVSYQLYQDAGRTQVWGNTVGADTVASVGTGDVQSYTVYGQVPAQLTPSAGVYADVVTVTVTY